MKIIFTNIFEIDTENYAPVPASKIIPDWYKNLSSYVGDTKKPNGEGSTTGTLKKCVPVFDALTAGYLIVSPADIFITQVDGIPCYEWSNHDLLSFHPVEQAPEHPARNNLPVYPKWRNPWAIKTPKGYSCLFTAPKHRDNVFTILDGIVDTDTYLAPVNFPFTLNNLDFEGIIPAGTPIAQVIPFKRDTFKMEIGNNTDLLNAAKVATKLKSKIFDSYKNQFWHGKEYK